MKIIKKTVANEFYKMSIVILGSTVLYTFLYIELGESIVAGARRDAEKILSRVDQPSRAKSITPGCP